MTLVHGDNYGSGSTQPLKRSNVHAVYAVTSEPAVEPISLADLKTAIRETTTDFDTELALLLTAGRRQVENDARIKLITQTVALKCDRWPVGSIIEIRQPPVQSITSVQYIDEDEATQTLDSSKYYTDLTTTPPRIWLDENEYWPGTDDQPNGVTITYQAGYGDAASDVPAEAILAITEWVKMAWGRCDGNRHIYDNLINVLSWTAVGAIQ
jgi:uncharacterized phiE125 gp8 family phage protein